MSPGLYYPPPDNEDTFDRLCCMLLSRHWGILNLTRHGRRGQGQNGVDFYGQNDRHVWHGGQSKLRIPPNILTEEEVREEVEKAKTFQPTLGLYVIVTSSRRDSRLQKLERELNVEHRKRRLFSIKIFFWDDILDLFQQHPQVCEAFYVGANASQLAKIESSITALAQHRGVGACEGQSHAEIDDAVQFIRNGDWRSARTLLERMRERQWHTYGPLEKFRVLANIGHTYEFEGKNEEVAKYFLQAAKEMPGEERAKVRATCAHTYLGNFEQARQLATELKDSHPENSDGYALWIRTAAEDVPFADLEQAVPAHLRTESNISFELSCRALCERRFDDAEKYARLGIRKEPSDPLLLAQLGISLIAREVSQHLVDTRFVPGPDTAAHLAEAIDKLSQALESPKNQSNMPARVELILKRAVAHDLLGHELERQADIIEAYKLNPDSVHACVKYAVLLDEQNKTDEAIRILDQARPDVPAERPLLLLAQLLSVRNTANDRERALDIAEGFLASLPPSSDQTPHVVEFFVRLSISTGKPERGEEFLNGPGNSRISRTLKHVLIGRIQYAANDRPAAKTSAMAAMATLTSESSRFDRLQLGSLLHALQEHEHVVATLREVIKPIVVTNDTIHLLDSARKSDELEFILQFCAGLRGAGVFDNQCIDLEIGLLHELHCLQSAIDITQELIANVTDEQFRRELIVRRSVLAIETDSQELIETDPAQLPPVETVNPPLGRMTVILLHRAHPLKAVEYAYELIRRHFNAPEARIAMITAFGFASGNVQIELPNYETVEAGAAVGYQQEDSETIEWKIIEDSPDPKQEFGELPLDHALAQELMGKRVGEEFFLRKNSLQDRTATIREIVPKYVYRLRECMGSWEERFPNQFFIQQIQVKHSPDGQPDFSPIFKSVDQRIEHTRTVDSVYREGPLPVYAVAEAQGESVISVMTHLIAQEIKCCFFSDADLQTAQKIVTAQRVVLDPSALATLFLIEAFDKLILQNGLWTITEATHREIREWRLRLHDRKGRGGFMTKVGDKHVMVPNDAFDHTRMVERFERFEAIVEDRMSIEPGDDILLCGKTLRQQLVKCFGVACAQSIALAMRPGYFLWTDDLVTATFAVQYAKCNRVWTQSVASWLSESGQIKSNLYDEVSLRLIESNYTYTLISPSIAMLAAKKSNWNPDEASLKKCIEWFSNRRTRPEPMFRLFVSTVKAIWTEVALLQTAEPITLRLLDEIAKLPHGMAMIRKLHKNSRLLFGLNVVVAQTLDDVIDAWLASGGGHSRIVLP